MRELIIDNFAGGGGASTGILQATGRHPDIAVNHDPIALACHRRNHPTTKHYNESVWDVDPAEACAGRPVGLAWFSPDCTHFSKAKGGAPRSQGTRGLAWVVLRWAKAVKPRVIILENVEEFTTWGPLTNAGQPCRDRAGETFGQWHQALEDEGYRIEYRTLHAHHYGTPTIRKRLFLVARCDGQPVVWPNPTHSDLPLDGLPPFRTFASCLDSRIKGKPLYGRAKALSERTIERVERGIVDCRQRHGYAHEGQFLIAYYGSESGSNIISEPLRTITTRDKFALVHYVGDNVTIRMLQPNELAAAQGFPRDYDWGELTKRDAVRLIGNSVCPQLAKALVEANYTEAGHA